MSIIPKSFKLPIDPRAQPRYNNCFSALPDFVFVHIIRKGKLVPKDVLSLARSSAKLCEKIYTVQNAIFYTMGRVGCPLPKRLFYQTRWFLRQHQMLPLYKQRTADPEIVAEFESRINCITQTTEGFFLLGTQTHILKVNKDGEIIKSHPSDHPVLNIAQKEHLTAASTTRSLKLINLNSEPVEEIWTRTSRGLSHFKRLCIVDNKIATQQDQSSNIQIWNNLGEHETIRVRGAAPQMILAHKGKLCAFQGKALLSWEAPSRGSKIHCTQFYLERLANGLPDRLRGLSSNVQGDTALISCKKLIILDTHNRAIYPSFFRQTPNPSIDQIATDPFGNFLIAWTSLSDRDSTRACNITIFSPSGIDLIHYNSRESIILTSTICGWDTYFITTELKLSCFKFDWTPYQFPEELSFRVPLGSP